MHKQTGAIAHFETDEDAQLAGYTEKLTAEEHAITQPMNRHERRKWAAKRRYEAKRKATR